MTDDYERLAAIRAALPPEGLFADKEWLISPEPFLIDGKFAEQLEKLGHRLQLFNRACNELYHRSISGKQPAWIAAYLDRGKPPELVEFSRRKEFRAELPRVIRPDLVLTEEGFSIAELDTIPGGMGLTQWLNATYAALGTHDILGGSDGMAKGFRAILGDEADILISAEASTYRPEMEYLCRVSGAKGMQVRDAESIGDLANRQLYRFFEHFDLPHIPSAGAIMEAVGSGKARITPPFKPYLEEKMWFALFWLRPLREFWRRELTERHFTELQKVIPYTWILDPQPLPHHAVIPGLEIQSFEELKHLSQKQRELILKISGFHETAWGSRSVVLGSDASQQEWEGAITAALRDFAEHPYILQRFHKGRLIDQRVFGAGGEMETMRGRVRLCPYYFVVDGKALLRGALATICPADKKLLHGMKDAIMAPTAVTG